MNSRKLLGTALTPAPLGQRVVLGCFPCAGSAGLMYSHWKMSADAAPGAAKMPAHSAAAMAATSLDEHFTFGSFRQSTRFRFSVRWLRDVDLYLSMRNRRADCSKSTIQFSFAGG